MCVTLLLSVVFHQLQVTDTHTYTLLLIELFPTGLRNGGHPKTNDDSKEGGGCRAEESFA